MQSLQWVTVWLVYDALGSTVTAVQRSLGIWSHQNCFGGVQEESYSKPALN